MARHNALSSRLPSLFILWLTVAALLGGCTPKEPSALGSATQELDAALVKLLPHYLTIQETLAADRVDGIAAPATAIAQGFTTIAPPEVEGPEAQNYRQMPKAAQDAATRLSTATDIKEARHHFLALSRAWAVWARNHVPEGIDLVWCPMVQGGWMQKQGPIRNPYYGASMLECGTKVTDEARARVANTQPPR